MEARIAQPYGQVADPAGRLAYNARGDLIFADTDNNRIRRVSNGVITTIAGTGDAGYSGDDGPGVSAQINHPIDIAIAEDGTVYFTDMKNNCVRKLDPAGVISRVAGRCSSNVSDRGFGGDGASPLDAKLNRPYGIDLEDNKLYISDTYNHRIRVVNL
jgi:adhesin/invasin